ncbi:hypothetical protein Slin15195_G085390 [Septoria linicola]|uniref:Uncharacterized protein n=1 Tax=Septoria linicola TaxID=215465 RepID=A0A9Q9AU75_9PEZI|nr:hypothetical protein Slin15195_G085390 [Septoria linicola]
MSRRETGLQSDPSSIAAIATLMGHPSLNIDLSELPSGSGLTADVMKQEIGYKRYRLEKWYSRAHDQRYGIVRAGALDRDSSPDPAAETEASYKPVNHEDLVKVHRWRWADYILLFVVAGTLGVVLAYYLVSGDNNFNVFFNSNTFGPRFIVTGAATVITSIWANVEQSSVVMAPFIQLYQGSSTAEALHFAPTITPLLSIWRAASYKYVFVCVVTLMTLLGETLSVAISGVPFSTGQTWTNFLAVSYISMAILSVMLIVGVAVIVHRRREPRIAIIPDTLGAKMSYLAGSSIVDVGGLSRNSGLSGRFTFSLMTSKDGRRVWRVDRFDSELEGF